MQVVGYCILGGITFEHLESENELEVGWDECKYLNLFQLKRHMVKQRLELGNTIWDITRNSPVTATKFKHIWHLVGFGWEKLDLWGDKSDVTIWERYCESYEGEPWWNLSYILNKSEVKGWDGHEDEHRRKWTFPGIRIVIYQDEVILFVRIPLLLHRPDLHHRVWWPDS